MDELQSLLTYARQLTEGGGEIAEVGGSSVVVSRQITQLEFVESNPAMQLNDSRAMPLSSGYGLSSTNLVVSETDAYSNGFDKLHILKTLLHMSPFKRVIRHWILVSVARHKATHQQRTAATFWRLKSFYSSLRWWGRLTAIQMNAAHELWLQTMHKFWALRQMKRAFKLLAVDLKVRAAMKVVKAHIYSSCNVIASAISLLMTATLIIALSYVLCTWSSVLMASFIADLTHVDTRPNETTNYTQPLL